MPKGKIVTCIECGQEFELSIEEIAYYEAKGMQKPKRCPICRALKGKYRYVKCAGCGTLMRIPLLTEVRNRRLYGEKYRPMKWCKTCRDKRANARLFVSQQ